MPGTIDQLNFEVIITDDKFKEKVKEDLAQAKELNVQLSALLDLQKQVGKFNLRTGSTSKEAINMAKLAKETANAAAAEQRLATAKTNTRIAAERLAAASASREAAESRAAAAAARAERSQQRLTTSLQSSNKAIRTQSRLLEELKGVALGYLSIRGASQLLQSLVRVTGEFELQKTTLAAMIGDLNTAETIVARIQSLAVQSPFQFKELTTYAKQLSAFAVPANELVETTKMLADISAGLGVGMDRIVLAYGQVRSAAFLRGQEVRQFTEAGIPILDELAKKFTELKGTAVSTGEVFELISKRMVPFEMVADIFKDMTAEGGKFYNMQSVQAETLKGKISNLKDAYEVMLNEIGKGQSENLKDAVDWVRRLMQNYEDTGKKLVELVALYGTYKTALLAITAMTGTFSIANHNLLGTLAKIGSAVASNPYVLIAAGLTAVGYSVYRAMTHLESYEKIQKSITDTQQKYTNSVVAETAKLDALYSKLRLASEGTKEYDEAKKAIYSQYASYISELNNEGIAVENLADIYGNLKTKIEETQQARFRAMASQNLDQVYDVETDSILKEVNKATDRLIKKLGIELNAIEREAIRAYVSGSLSKSDIETDARVKRVATLLSQAATSGNDEWRQFGFSIEHARTQFELSTKAFQEGVKAIDDIYGHAQEETASGTSPFVYGLEEEKEDNKAQKAIEARIRSIQRLQDAYEKLRPYINDEQMRNTLKSLFPNIEQGLLDSLDFKSALDKATKDLEAFDKEAAQNIRESLGVDRADNLADQFKDFLKYKEAVDKWAKEDFNFYGGDEVGKILRDLSKEYESIEKKRRNTLELLRKAEAGDAEAIALLRTTLGEEVWKKYVTEGKKAIEELANAERTVAYKDAEEKAKDKASEILKKRMEEENIDLTDFGDKSIAQVRTLLQRLGNLKADIEAEMAKLEEGGLTENEKIRLAALIEALKILGKQAEDTGEELDKKIGDALKKIASQKVFANIGKEISDFGKQIGNVALEDFGQQVTDIANLAGDLAGKIHGLAEELKGVDLEKTSFNDLSESAKGGVISIVATAALAFYKQIKNAIVDYIQHQDILNEKLYEYRDLMRELRREDFTNIFGTDEMALAAENAKILTEAQQKYNATLDEMNEKRIQGFRTNFIGGRSEVKNQSLIDMLERISEGQGWDLYKNDGNVNIDALEMYFDTFSKRLTRRQRKLVEELIENGKALDDAAAQQAEYLTDLFSGVADSIADSMVEAFIESGNAAIDMGEIMSDVTKKMAVDMLKSIILERVFKNYQQDLEKIWANTEANSEERIKATSELLNNAKTEIEGLIPDFQQILEDIGLLQAGKDEARNDLGAGIKGITEDTANLLASYLNAIRADVSYARAIWERMDVSMQQIAAALAGFSAPSLMEYQAQIASNTYNTMISTQSILSRLESVMDYGDGAASIRVR